MLDGLLRLEVVCFLMRTGDSDVTLFDEHHGKLNGDRYLNALSASRPKYGGVETDHKGLTTH